MPTNIGDTIGPYSRVLCYGALNRGILACELMAVWVELLL